MFKKQTEKKVPVDYKEPYEFRLLIGDNIICQRYFRINNFNPLSINSLEFLNTIRYCAQMIDEDLKSKTRVYSWYMTPLVFNNEEEMYHYFSNPNYLLRTKVGDYQNIVIKNDELTEYIWDGEKIIKSEKKTDEGIFTTDLTEKDFLTFEFAFYINGKKTISTIFEGVYPNFIRRNIDLSNMRGKFEGEDITRLGFESFIFHRLVVDRTDLIKKIVKELCTVCSVSENDYYTTKDRYSKRNYDLNFNDVKKLNSKFGKEIAKAKKYFEENKWENIIKG